MNTPPPKPWRELWREADDDGRTVVFDEYSEYHVHLKPDRRDPRLIERARETLRAPGLVHDVTEPGCAHREAHSRIDRHRGSPWRGLYIRVIVEYREEGNRIVTVYPTRTPPQGRLLRFEHP